MVSALRTCASCFAVFSVCSAQLSDFCSAHLCKLLHLRRDMIAMDWHFCSAHLCKLLPFLDHFISFPFALLLCALVQVASAKLHSSLRQAVEAICIGAQLHIISKCELPFNSTIDSNDMIVRRANLSWQQ